MKLSKEVLLTSIVKCLSEIKAEDLNEAEKALVEQAIVRYLLRDVMLDWGLKTHDKSTHKVEDLADISNLAHSLREETSEFISKIIFNTDRADSELDRIKREVV